MATDISEVPIARTGAAMTILEDKMFVWGGYSQEIDGEGDDRFPVNVQLPDEEEELDDYPAIEVYSITEHRWRRYKTSGKDGDESNVPAFGFGSVMTGIDGWCTCLEDGTTRSSPTTYSDWILLRWSGRSFNQQVVTLQRVNVTEGWQYTRGNWSYLAGLELKNKGVELNTLHAMIPLFTTTTVGTMSFIYSILKPVSIMQSDSGGLFVFSLSALPVRAAEPLQGAYRNLNNNLGFFLTV